VPDTFGNEGRALDAGAAAPEISALRFLIVEDRAFQRGLLAKILASLGAREIHEATDGRAALDFIRATPQSVDIVITDMDMPAMDGLEFIRHLGEAGERVSVIVASALDQPLLASIATMARAYGVRLLGVVEKPITAQRLRQLLRLHGAAQATPAPVQAVGRVFSVQEILDGLTAGQFEPHFQPQVSPASGRMESAEALARWRHPHLGLVPPGAFVPTLEGHGKVEHLTWAMLHGAAAACRHWRTAGIDASVSVNLSLSSLDDVHHADRIIEIVRAEGLEPQHMILEVTESAACTDLGRVLENLTRLRMKGFGLSIDDYGTGYSSMQQLARIAFTELKVDRSFVIGAAARQSAAVILESSLGMARKLGIRAVAEGVENAEDLDLLRRLGCSLVQGYLIARPMSAQALERWAAERRGAG
jgi:EAL domain-containing protein (putative c-di-GMP-specific phosphodiesterase class I)